MSAIRAYRIDTLACYQVGSIRLASREISFFQIGIFPQELFFGDAITQ